MRPLNGFSAVSNSMNQVDSVCFSTHSPVLCCFQEKLAFHRRSRKLLSPGLYLGYLKLWSSVDQIRALVPQKLPNVLCHTKIRDNCNVSRPVEAVFGTWGPWLFNITNWDWDY